MSDPRFTLDREFARLFHDIVYNRHPASHFTDRAWAPPLDVMVSEQAIRVLVELAGVPREQIRVNLHGRMLEISGRRELPRPPDVSHFHRAEIIFGEFRRTIELPWEPREDSIQATYKDGFLEIQLSAAPAPQRRTIPIEHHSTR